VTLPPAKLFVPELDVLTIVPVAPLVKLVLVLQLFAWPLVVLDVLLLIVLDVLLLEDPDEPKPAVPD
jgi:hypothetical protein